MNGHTAKQNTDKTYFEKLFMEYSDVIYRLCLFKTSRKSVAQDLTQDAFLGLWKAIESGKEINKPKQYLYQITRNLIVDYYKSKKTVSLDTLEEQGFDPADTESTPDVVAEAKLLREMIDRLDEHSREVLYMRFVEGLKVKEIAELLNISQNLVSIRIIRGKKKLNEKFRQQ